MPYRQMRCENPPPQLSVMGGPDLSQPASTGGKFGRDTTCFQGVVVIVFFFVELRPGRMDGCVEDG
jgi:hypothetical protein